MGNILLVCRLWCWGDFIVIIVLKGGVVGGYSGLNVLVWVLEVVEGSLDGS